MILLRRLTDSSGGGKMGSYWNGSSMLAHASRGCRPIAAKSSAHVLRTLCHCLVFPDPNNSFGTRSRSRRESRSSGRRAGHLVRLRLVFLLFYRFLFQLHLTNTFSGSFPGFIGRKFRAPHRLSRFNLGSLFLVALRGSFFTQHTLTHSVSCFGSCFFRCDGGRMSSATRSPLQQTAGHS